MRFEWKKNGAEDIGFIAEEVGKVVPEIVTYEDNGVDARSVNYSHLVALLVEAIKDQQEQIENQQKQIDDLLNEINSIKEVLNMS